MRQDIKGIVAVAAASTVWGLAVLYYRALIAVPPLELLAHRMIWTLATFGVALGLLGRLKEVRALLRGPERGRVMAAAMLISFNWGLFIWAVNRGHAVEASLGYYIFPLVAVLFAVAAQGEKLGLLRGLAVALAALGVVTLTWGLGLPPWTALALAVSFASYGLLKSRMAVSAVVSVTAETLVLAPVALGGLLAMYLTGWQGGGQMGRDPGATLLLPLAGIITGGPLILFTWGAARVRMSTLGMVQYINPTLQMLIAVVLLAEPFTRWHAVAFGMIWLALGLYTFGLIGQDRAARRAVSSDATSATVIT